MHKIEKTAAQVIAGDTSASVDAIDKAVAQLATLCASIVEVSKASNLPIATAQTALAKAGESLNGVIGSRADMATATRELTAIQRRSNLRETGFGCPPLERGHSTQPAEAKIDA
ncbi:hypothetical protein [Aurantiacibacter aquimixticola]|uniref:Uncharacterized protein n=1 Tax=Aurantiacibacter aquimixticola TaxID=1958945 RepID=A0A419RVZ7_9SPHN|nr:hypothetical protein [Aurantiacibacter aquimixticola]RJY09937.1 hypothetical protein D6201_11795 [Aurantiacibacter aquimixticola]